MIWRPRSRRFLRRAEFSPNPGISNTARSNRKWPWPWPRPWSAASIWWWRPAPGVGKSLAYLIPSILFAVAARKKAVISTNTINLQEQLIEKDLPMLARILPVKFDFTMLKGRQNYLCTRRLARTLPQAGKLFTSSDEQELQRIHEWSKKTGDGSLSDFDLEPDAKVWQQVCSERGLCSPKLCGFQSDFVKDGGTPCFYQRARSRVLASDVLVLNHTLFFMQLGLAPEEPGGGLLFKNDFVIFDEAHTVERVASRHIGLSVSSAQLRYSLQRLWNPATSKGLLALLRKGRAAGLVEQALGEGEKFFAAIEQECDRLFGQRSREGGTARAWSELRIRQPDLVPDNLTLPMQNLREEIAEMVKLARDKDTAQELTERNRHLGELRDGLAQFLNQSAPRARLLGGARRQGAAKPDPQRRADQRGRIPAPAALRRRHLRHHDQRHPGHPSKERNGSTALQTARPPPLKPRPTGEGRGDSIAAPLACISPAKSARKRPPSCKPARPLITSGR